MSSKNSLNDLRLIKAALRRAFARSDIHKQVEDAYRIEHSDPKRPRCQKWSWCSNCGQVVPTWTTDVDHITPVQPLDRLLEHMTKEEILKNIWCDPNNLAVSCFECHNSKTKFENSQRPKRKKKVKNERK